jgi:hypothetical protein
MAKTVIAAFLWMLVGVMVGSFLERQVAQPTVRKIETDQQKANVLEQKPPTDHAWEAPPTLLAG